MARRTPPAARNCLNYVCRSSKAPGGRPYVAARSLYTTSAPRAVAVSPAASAISKGRGSLQGLQWSADVAPATQPPSARPIDTRKSQLIRTYTSMLRTAPLILLFQHSNITAVEWAAIRRELKKAISAVPLSGTDPLNIGPQVQLSVTRTNMLRVAMQIVEFFDPEAAALQSSTSRTSRGALTHDLSQAAYDSIRKMDVPPDSAYAQMMPLLVGPTAALVFPSVSPQHLAAALSILSPVPGKFPAPTRKKNPGYHDPLCQSGISKLALIGGRIESKVFDQNGVVWVGSIGGGLDGLRAQLVHALQGASFGITSALESSSRGLWLALEGRKGQLEEESKTVGDDTNSGD